MALFMQSKMAAPMQSRRSIGDKIDFDDDELDPRIQVELERLNNASEDINRLELELDEARSGFRQVLTDSTHLLNGLTKKLGSCIEKARPYYEARMHLKEVQLETQNAALRFDRACGQLMAAKEMVYLAEQGYFCKGQPFDPAWQEMLNHATIKVNDAEKERLESELAHRNTAAIFNDAEQNVNILHKELKRHISKSKPYFETKAKFNQQMNECKRKVDELESMVTAAKRIYAGALYRLESISDEIHRQRDEAYTRACMGARGSGVGAETPTMNMHDNKRIRHERTRTLTEDDQQLFDSEDTLEQRSQDNEYTQTCSQRRASDVVQQSTRMTSQNSTRSQSSSDAVLRTSHVTSPQDAQSSDIIQRTSHVTLRNDAHSADMAQQTSHVTSQNSIRSQSSSDMVQRSSPVTSQNTARSQSSSDTVQQSTSQNAARSQSSDTVQRTQLSDDASTHVGSLRDAQSSHVRVSVRPASAVLPSIVTDDIQHEPAVERMRRPICMANEGQTRLNALIMARVQRLKVDGCADKRDDDNNDVFSDDTDSMSSGVSGVSGATVDDEVIDSLTSSGATNDDGYKAFLARLNATAVETDDNAPWRTCTLPAKLAHLSGYVRAPLRHDSDGIQRQNSHPLENLRKQDSEAEQIGNEENEHRGEFCDVDGGLNCTDFKQSDGLIQTTDYLNVNGNEYLQKSDTQSELMNNGTCCNINTSLDMDNSVENSAARINELQEKNNID